MAAPARMTWKVGDTGLSRTITCKDALDAAVNLQGSTVVWTMVNRNTRAEVVSATLAGAELVDLENGQIARSRSASTDTAAAGRYLAEVQVTYAAGEVQTFPEQGYIEITVVEDLD